MFKGKQILNMKLRRQEILQNSVYVKEELENSRSTTLKHKSNSRSRIASKDASPAHGIGQSRSIVELANRPQLPELTSVKGKMPLAFQILNHKLSKSPQTRAGSKENPAFKVTADNSPFATRARRVEVKQNTEVSVNPTTLDSNPSTFRVLEQSQNRKFIVHKTFKKPPQTKPYLRSEPNSLIPKSSAIEIPKHKHERLFSIIKPTLMKPVKDPLIKVDFANIKPLASIGFRTVSGIIGGKSKLNQDVVYLNNSLLNGVMFLGVFDGHGLNGHRVAGFLALNFEGKHSSRRCGQFSREKRRSLRGDPERLLFRESL